MKPSRSGRRRERNGPPKNVEPAGNPSGSDAERDLMALMLTTNARLVADVLVGGSAPSSQQVLRAIAATRSLAAMVDETLRALVDQARRSGHTWAEVGEVLHVTRQAAFQRFGGGLPPTATEERPETQAVQRAVELAVPILAHFLDERWQEVRASFDERMLAACPVEMLIAAHRKVLPEAGGLQQIGKPRVSVRHGYTVVDVPTAFEHGDRTGRVVINTDGEVSGFFVLPPDPA